MRKPGSRLLSEPRQPGSGVKRYGKAAKKQRDDEANRKLHTEAAIEFARSRLAFYYYAGYFKPDFEQEVVRGEKEHLHEALMICLQKRSDDAAGDFLPAKFLLAALGVTSARCIHEAQSLLETGWVRNWFGQISDEEMPSELKVYAEDFLRAFLEAVQVLNRTKLGKTRWRDDAIAEVVEWVVACFGLRHRRGRASVRKGDCTESGFSIVKAALERLGVYIAESSLEDAFKRAEQRVAIPLRRTLHVQRRHLDKMKSDALAQAAAPAAAPAGPIAAGQAVTFEGIRSEVGPVEAMRYFKTMALLDIFSQAGLDTTSEHEAAQDALARAAANYKNDPHGNL